jgi:hypothetical protein
MVNLFSKKYFVTDFTFPNNEDLPALRFKGSNVFRIALSVALYFRNPIVLIALWLAQAFDAGVPMPEAAMDKHGSFSTNPSNIGLPWEVSAVNAVAGES